MLITVETLKGWGACYWDHDGSEMAAKCEAELPASPIDIARAEWVPAQDRLWVLLRPEIIPEKQLHLLACDFAEDVLQIYEAQFPGDPRPRQAIKTKRRWIAGSASDAELVAVRAAAEAAVRSATGAAATEAADAAWAAAGATTEIAASACIAAEADVQDKCIERIIAVLKELES